jgi:hypothetical protein
MPVEAGEAVSPAVDVLRSRLSGFETEEGRLRGLGFRCAPIPVKRARASRPPERGEREWARERARESARAPSERAGE